MSLAFLVLAGSASIVTTAFAAPSAEEAARRSESKRHLNTGKKLLRENFATDAVTELEKSLELYPTIEAEEELAAANRVLGRTLAARGNYDSILATYGATLKAKDRSRIESQRALVDQDVARLFIDSEPSAHVIIDGNDVGTTPLAAPIELDPGRHGLAITKEGYVEERRVVELPTGSTRISAPLKVSLTTGKVTIKADPPQAGTVTIDGRDAGVLPLTVELPPGKHRIVVNSQTASSVPKEIEVRLGDTQVLSIPMNAYAAKLRVEVPDPTYVVVIDDANRATGGFQGELSPGMHRIVIEKQGFSPYTRVVTLRAGESSQVVAPVLAAIAVAAAPGAAPHDLPGEPAEQKPKNDYPGVYAGLSLIGLVGPTAKQGLWDTCPAGSGNCDRLTALGGGLGFRLGYSFGWIGIEGLVMGLADASANKMNFKEATDQSMSPFFGPVRTDAFSFLRYGVGGALGLRLAAPVPGVRPTLGVAGGFMARWVRYLSAATVNGSVAQGIVPDAQDHNSDVQSFVAPALIADAGLLIGSTPGLKMHLALLFMAEFDPSKTAESFSNTVGTQITVAGRTKIPHGAPEIPLTTGTQLFLGPVLGMQFGH